MQPSGPVSQPTTAQTVTATGQSASQATKLQTTTGSTEVSATGPVDQNVHNQNLTGKKVLPTSSLSGAALSQNSYSDLEQHSYLSSPAHPMEEEGRVSDQDTTMPEQELDQQLSEEQNYWETIRGFISFMGWHQV